MTNSHRADTGHDKRAPPNDLSEGPACQLRFPITDNPLPFRGHDERAPPNDLSEGRARQVRFPSEGPARQGRLSTLDEPPQFARVSVRRLKFDHPLPFGGD
jgi:hypothetical protein